MGCLKAVMSLKVQRNKTTLSCSFRIGAIFTKNQTGVPGNKHIKKFVSGRQNSKCANLDVYISKSAICKCYFNVSGVLQTPIRKNDRVADKSVSYILCSTSDQLFNLQKLLPASGLHLQSQYTNLCSTSKADRRVLCTCKGAHNTVFLVLCKPCRQVNSA